MYKFAILLLFIIAPCFAEKDLSKFEFEGYPKFSDYPVMEIYEGKNHVAVEDETTQKTFKDLSFALSQPVNFAGHYIVYTFSCGNTCLTGYIADAKTGKNIIAFPHFYLLNDQSDNNPSVIFKKESSLILFTGITENDPNSYKGEYYALKNNNLIFLKSYSIDVSNNTNEKQGNKQCKDLDLDENYYLSGHVCFYPQATLLDIYSLYQKENIDNENGKYLREHIEPLKNYDDIIAKGNIEVTYKWINKKELKIELFFAGGITELTFQEKDNGTEITTIYNAD